jgi:septal ring-binding cell division protein DamX
MIDSTSERRTPGAGEGDLMGGRLAATQRWLAKQTPTTYSIQLLGAADDQLLKRRLSILSKSIEMNKVFVYRTTAKGKPFLTVLYGSYGDREAAQGAMADLPAELKAYRPLLRTVQGIRREIEEQPSS